ncbi:hypothetical protein PV646_32195 [Streptomyces sp. ID05-26A]|nr:hypothetical protein [Streptomyces sp. ID05-26A]
METVRGDDEQYLADRLDQVQKALRQGDTEDVVRQVGHVRGESDPKTADTLLRLALDRELKESRKKIRIWMAAAIVLAVGAAITIAVTVPRTKLSTLMDTATTATTETRTVVSTVPVPVATPSTPSGSLAPPVPAPDGSNFTVLHELTDFTLGTSPCDTTLEGTLNIDELAPDGDKPTISNCLQNFEIDSRGGKYIAEAPLTQPTAEQCETQSKRGSRAQWNRGDLKPGQFAVCVTSKAGNVAWIKLVDKAQEGQLLLKVVVWKPGRR